METKPFSLQAPEQVAKDYGGDKQKIAQAIQMGLVDPTAGTLAGMFIDRMRSAAQAEMAPQQTVAQQVFAPPMGVPQGLGATPQAAQMGMAPPQGAPPMMPPQGVGLDALPVPDEMFEPGYAGGGLVAFQTGGSVEEDEELARYRRTLTGVRPMIASMFTPKTEASQAFSEFTQQEMTPEALARRRKDDMWMALGQAGARMAQTPGTLLQAIGAGVGEAIPMARESAKERRAELFEMYKARAMQEGLSNKQASEVAKMETDAAMNIEQTRESRAVREQRERQMERQAQNEAARLGLDAERLALARRELEVKIEQAENLGADPRRVAGQMMLTGTPEEKKVAEEFFIKTNPRAAGGMSNLEKTLLMVGAGGRGGGAGDPYEGFSAKLRSGE
jgi:hypothetical protein